MLAVVFLTVKRSTRLLTYWACFVCMCYLHTEAYKLGLPLAIIDIYWQNFLTLSSGDKVNLHFTKTSTKNKNLKSV